MSKKLYEENSIKAIADAIRGKNGSTDTYKLVEMAAAITAIETGGGAQPQLNAPTISITNDTLTITPNKNNGNFVTGYNVYVNPGTGYVLFGTTTTLTNDLTQYSVPPGDYSIKVTAAGENFIESDYSNELNYTNVFYTVTNTLTNCTSNNSTTSIRKGSAYSATITANSGYVLKDTDVTVTMNGENISATAYSDSVITINSVDGNIVITISATKLNGVQWQATAAPLDTGYTLLTEYSSGILAANYAGNPNDHRNGAISSDGIIWKSQYLPIYSELQQLKYSGGYICGTADNLIYLTSQDFSASAWKAILANEDYPRKTRALAINNETVPSVIAIINYTCYKATYTNDKLTKTNPTGLYWQTNDYGYGAFGNSKFVFCKAGKSDYYISTDSSGDKFTKKTASITFPKRTFDTTYTQVNYPQQHQMIYANGMFVIKGTGTQVAYSTDGENWALAGTADDSSDDRFNVAYGDGSWIAVSPNGKEAFSNNGIDWEVHEIDYKPKDIIFCNGKFIAVESETTNSKIIYGVV